MHGQTMFVYFTLLFFQTCQATPQMSFACKSLSLRVYASKAQQVYEVQLMVATEILPDC